MTDTRTGIDFEFLSTPSARRATAAAATDGFAEEISIHALREEGDFVSYSLKFTSS